MPLMSLLLRPLAGFMILAGMICLSAAPASAQAIPTAVSGTATPDDGAALKTLIEVLKDDAARQRLIEDLERRADGTAADSTPTAITPNSFGGDIAQVTQGAVQSGANAVKQFWTGLRAAPAMFGALWQADYRSIGQVWLELGILVIITYALWLAMLGLTRGMRKMLERRAASSGLVVKAIAVLVQFAINVAIIAIAWSVGTIVAAGVLGPAGQMSFNQSLFLNAFLVAQLLLALIYAVLAPQHPSLRPVPISDHNANMLARWSLFAVNILIFGQLLLVPVFHRNISVASALAISVLDYLIVLALVLNLVLRMREAVTAWLVSITSQDDNRTLKFMARYWHVPVIIYLVMLFLVVMIWPPEALLSMLVATIKIAIAIGLGLTIANLLNRIILNGVKLPPRLSDRIPLLEQRLNAFVPRALALLRLMVVLVVAAITLDSIGLFSIGAWLDSDIGGRFASAIATIAIILVLAFAAWLTVSSWVDYRLQGEGSFAVKSRERTLLALMRNAISIALAVFTGMFVLSEIGINIAPLLASAGVIGLAIGFGSQKLVQDVITGIFMQLEGAIDVGDVVNIAGIAGKVERLTIRSASLRDVNGVYHIVPFSSVDTVSNFMRGFAFAVCDMGVAYRENIDDVKQAMDDAFAELKADPAFANDIVATELEWMGIDKFAESAVIVRTRIKVLPGQQWSVGRAFNGRIKTIFDARDIEIALPHQTIYFGQDRDGAAPPVRIVTGGTPPKSPRLPASTAASSSTRSELDLPEDSFEPEEDNQS
ncbi:mechanosensitive ion channel domain-containing protein [Devosia sp.]|uniref:mechanosensitive ion channel domain-containing protein n=1 Tax=Devosia sp. TaxID=1871048 RepID=UPI003263B5B1